jgi:iron complex outermembrane receptor protein
MPSIVVTATRSSQSWLEVPLAINVVNRSTIVGRKGLGLDDALSGIAGVLAQSRYGGGDVRLTIRGFGARGSGERSNAGTSRGVRVLVDGFPETEPDGRTSFDLIDLSAAERIEVVRSNASSVWGNASGGIVSVTTSADISTPYAEVGSTFGSYGYRKDQIKAAAPIGNGSLTLLLTNSNYDGWREHSSSMRTLMNTSLVSSLDERTEVGVYLAAATNQFRIPGPLTRAEFDADPRQAQDDTLNYKPTYVQRDERRNNKLGRLGVRLTRAFNSRNSVTAAAFVAPKVLQRSERNTFRDFTRYHFGGSFTYQNVTAIDKRWTNAVLVGVDEAYQDGAILFYSLDHGERGSALKDNKREGAENLGVFVQNELTLVDKLYLITGARWDAITYYYESRINPKLNADKSFKRLTPKLGVSYRFTPTLSSYVNYAGGIEVPAGNETDPPSTFGEDTVTALNPLLDPIRSTTIETGVKQQLVGDTDALVRSLTYDVALYRIEVRDDIIPYRSGRFYLTAGKTRRLGVELNAALNLRHGFSAQGAATFCRSRYVDYVVDSVHYGKPGKIADYGDKRMAGQPDFFSRMSIKCAPPMLRGVFAQLGAQAVGKYYADDANAVSVPSYTIFDAAVGLDGLRLGKSGLAVSGFVGVSNIADKHYASSAYINPDLDQTKKYPIYLEPGLPRNWVASVAVRWVP